MNLPSPSSPDFLAGWQAAFNAILEEMQYLPPSKVGEARFTARLVALKASLGVPQYVSNSHTTDPLHQASDHKPSRKG